MALKDILLYMDASPACQSRLDLASVIAQRFKAHVTGLLVKPQPVQFGYVMADFGTVFENDVLANVQGEERAYVEKVAASVGGRFREQLARDGVAFEWRSVVGSVAQQISLRARYADIAVIGQPDPRGRSLADQLSVAGEILLTSGRPILVVPYTGRFPTIGERVLIAWNGSREAARAVNDALPFLVKAKAVTILSIDPQSGSAGEGAAPGEDLGLHLARHGIKVESASMVGNEISVGDMLLSRAADWTSDLIVMGAYGHSRFRELVLGGATRSLLKTMTVPVLMSH